MAHESRRTSPKIEKDARQRLLTIAVTRGNVAQILASGTCDPETRLAGCAGSLARSGLRFEKFPARRGKSREIGGNPANFMKTAAQCCRNFKALRDEFPGMSIREFWRASREVTGSHFRGTGKLVSAHRQHKVRLDEGERSGGCFAGEVLSALMLGYLPRITDNIATVMQSLD